MSFYTSLTGLNGAQTELQTISNNIANTSTNGFKKSRVSFGDIISTSPLANPARVIGSGTSVRQVSQQSAQGAIETSDNALDMAISGQGFFTLKSGIGDAEVSFTRNGAFSVNADRFVDDATGRKLQVFPTTTDGSVLTTKIASTISAKLPLTSGLPLATSGIRISLNLPSDAEAIPLKPIYTAANPYVFDRSNGSTFNNSTSTTIYDSLGNPLAATVYYVKTAVPTAADPQHHWTAHVFVGDTQLTSGGAAGFDIAFDAAGVLTAPLIATVFDAFTPTTGGADQVLSLDHGIATTQQSGPFALRTISQDGVAPGQLESVSVDQSGALKASFSNGEQVILGKVAVATFADSSGLKQIGDASYLATPESGQPITGEAGNGGIGSILSGSLERSNVDLTEELVGLISAQRTFQANAKAIETSSTLLQTIINIRQ